MKGLLYMRSPDPSPRDFVSGSLGWEFALKKENKQQQQKKTHNTENSILSSSGLFLLMPQKDGLAIPGAATREQSFQLGQETTEKFLRISQKHIHSVSQPQFRSNMD